jgi:hypothetical protein
VRDVFAKHAGYVREETLANELIEGEPEDAGASETAKIEGGEVTLGVTKAE